MKQGNKSEKQTQSNQKEKENNKGTFYTSKKYIIQRKTINWEILILLIIGLIFIFFSVLGFIQLNKVPIEYSIEEEIDFIYDFTFFGLLFISFIGGGLIILFFINLGEEEKRMKIKEEEIWIREENI